MWCVVIGITMQIKIKYGGDKKETMRIFEINVSFNSTDQRMFRGTIDDPHLPLVTFQWLTPATTASLPQMLTDLTM